MFQSSENTLSFNIQMKWWASSPHPVYYEKSCLLPVFLKIPGQGCTSVCVRVHEHACAHVSRQRTRVSGRWGGLRSSSDLSLWFCHISVSRLASYNYSSCSYLFGPKRAPSFPQRNSSARQWNVSFRGRSGITGRATAWHRWKTTSRWIPGLAVVGALQPAVPREEFTLLSFLSPWLLCAAGTCLSLCSDPSLFQPPLEKSSAFPNSSLARRDSQTSYMDEESWGEQSDWKLGVKALFQSLLCLKASCFDLDCMLFGVGWGSNGG